MTGTLGYLERGGRVGGQVDGQAGGPAARLTLRQAIQTGELPVKCMPGRLDSACRSSFHWGRVDGR